MLVGAARGQVSGRLSPVVLLLKSDPPESKLCRSRRLRWFLCRLFVRFSILFISLLFFPLTLWEWKLVDCSLVARHLGDMFHKINYILKPSDFCFLLSSNLQFIGGWFPLFGGSQNYVRIPKYQFVKAKNIIVAIGNKDRC